ncbi:MULTISPECIES: tetratricopeptide repeat protein [Winogradskyella]|uniref:tetratricopeptide repeat protein n=1 Tax=Winogradskyella TaxID=286104 RepID=UPI0015C77AE5|nr:MULTISPECIES: hypothetical protein [Winogradskyella]QXP78473.1 hypothetical protein H0I32_14825 [Winogradskyella sp. HaHa_3_26]
MSLTRREVIKQIEHAEALYKANLYAPLQSVISNIQENFDVLGDNNLADNARYYRIYMLYLGAFEEMNMDVMESYLQALIDINEVLPSDYEYVCSYYKECKEWVYETALMTYSYNETLHIHYALKLQEDKRFEEAIITLKYVLECYPALTEARLLLWDIQSAQLEQLCASSEEADCFELLDLASATHNKTVLKGLQLDDRLDQAGKNLAMIQVEIWSKWSAEIKKLWDKEWKYFDLTDHTRLLLADFAKNFMRYDFVSQIVATPPEPEFPEENYSNFEEYQTYMKALANSGWQSAQHQYVLIGNAGYYHTKHKPTIEACVERGLALNPKNPLLHVLKAKSYFLDKDYNQTGVAYHEAFRNGLRMSEYLQYLLEVNGRIESWQGILDIVVQFHRRETPTLKTLFFQARALFRLHRFDEALEVINEALADFPLPKHSFAPWLYNLRMNIHRINHNYTAFFEDMQEEINFYEDDDSDYFSTMNMCIEVLVEMGDYEECHKYAIYNFEQEQLPTELKPVFQWICYYTFLEHPEELGKATADDLIDNPTTFSEYRNNGFIQWMLRDNTAGAESLKMAAELSTNKACYLKLALDCLTAGFDNKTTIALCETIKKEVPEARDWQLDFDYANTLQQDKRYKDAKIAYKNLLQSYPKKTFINFPKDQYHVMLRAIKNMAKGLDNVEDYTKYNAMYLSKDNPSETALLEHLEIAKTHYKDDLFLQHNLLESVSKRNIEFENGELEMLNEMKTRIRADYFV